MVAAARTPSSQRCLLAVLSSLCMPCLGGEAHLEKWGEFAATADIVVADGRQNGIYYIMKKGQGVSAVRFDPTAPYNQRSSVVADWTGGWAEGAWWVATSGGLLYVVGGTQASLTVLDVSDVETGSIRQVGLLLGAPSSGVSNCYRVMLSRSTIYAACQRGGPPDLHVFDVTTATPVFRFKMADYGPLCVDDDNHVLFANTSTATLQVLDLSSRLLPRPLKDRAVQLPGIPKGCRVQGGFVYVSGQGFFVVLNASSPTLERVDTSGPSMNIPGSEVDTMGRTAFIHTDDSFLLLDVGNPTQPRVISEVPLPSGRTVLQVDVLVGGFGPFLLAALGDRVVQYRVFDAFPPTPAPTSVPATPVPPTPEPTGVPPTAAPPTLAPPTLGPTSVPTAAPQTLQPTAVPLLPTPVPPVSDVPDTPAPMAPPSPAPLTPAPETAAPGTLAPLKSLSPGTLAPTLTPTLAPLRSLVPSSTAPETAVPLVIRTVLPPPAPLPSAAPVPAAPTAAPTVAPPQPTEPVDGRPGISAPPSPAPSVAGVTWCEVDSTCRIHNDPHAWCDTERNLCICSPSYSPAGAASVCVSLPAGDVLASLRAEVELSGDCAAYLPADATLLSSFVGRSFETDVAAVVLRCDPLVLSFVLLGASVAKVTQIDLAAELGSSLDADLSELHTRLGQPRSWSVVVTTSCVQEGADVSLDASGTCTAYSCITGQLQDGACVAEADPAPPTAGVPITAVAIGCGSFVVLCLAGVMLCRQRWASSDPSFTTCGADTEMPLVAHDLPSSCSQQPLDWEETAHSATPLSFVLTENATRSHTGVDTAPVVSALSNSITLSRKNNVTAISTQLSVAPRSENPFSLRPTFGTESLSRSSQDGSLSFEMMESIPFSSVSLRSASDAPSRCRVGPLHDLSLASWRTTELLGRGSYSTVYLGEVRGGGTRPSRSAMKLYRRQTDDTALQVAEQVSLLRQPGEHRNIVSLLDVIYVCDTRTLCVFMEYVDGPTLSTLAQAGMEEAEAARIMRQVVAGVRHLHSHDLVHRDIKGENVLLTADRSVAKLCDFGFLKTLGGLAGGTVTADTVGSTLAGTPGWMAPEVVDMGLDFVQTGKPADIYSIGCTLSEMLNNGVPQEANQMKCKEAQGLPDNMAEDISDDARNFIVACLQVDPDARPTVVALEVHPFISAGVPDERQRRTTRSAGTRKAARIARLSLREMTNWAQNDTLGKGSYGTVYLGQLPDARQVAVKVVTAQHRGAMVTMRKQAEAEFRLLESLHHRNIVQCLGHKWVGDNRLEIFLELVTGGTVRGLVKRMQGGRLMDSVVHVYTKQVLCALDYLHVGEGGRPPIAHRDLKGDNLLIDKEGTVKLADFGCSKLFEKHSTAVSSGGAKTVIGTPNWIAPEVLHSGKTENSKSYGTKCDIWSLGCTIIEMLGRTPWRVKSGESSYEVMHRIATSEGGPPLPSDVPAPLRDFLNLCFIRDPGQRPSAACLLASEYITHNPKTGSKPAAPSAALVHRQASPPAHGDVEPILLD